jgi:hypothetical protein
MKIIIMILCLFPSVVFSKVPLPRASTGLELGVARLSDGNKAMIGTSWMYVLDYQPDKHLSFFGQAGSAQGESDGHKIKQTSFNGGVQFFILPRMGLQLGVATTVLEITDDKLEKKHELGPLLGLNIYYPVGVFKFGTSATVIRTKTVHSMALRGSLLLEF